MQLPRLCLFDPPTERARRGYIVFWAILALLAVAYQVLIGSLYGQDDTFLGRALLTGIFVFLAPTLLIFTSRQHAQLLGALNQGRPIPPPYSSHIQSVREVYSLGRSGYKLLALAIFLVTLVILYFIPKPSLPLGPAILFYSGGLLGLLMASCAFATYMIIGYAVFTMPKEHFYLGFMGNETLAVRRYASLLYYLVLSSIALYASHAFAIWIAGLALHPAPAAWLLVTSFFPLTFFLLAAVRVHQVMRHIKSVDQDIVRNMIDLARQKFETSRNRDDVAILSDLVNIKRAVDSMKEWPFGGGGILTLLLRTPARESESRSVGVTD